MSQMQDEIFRVGVCTECKQEDILDTNRDICWECWCILDISNQESESVLISAENDDTEEE